MGQIEMFPDDGAKSPPAPKQKAIDQLVDAIFMALPADSIPQIQQRLAKSGLTVAQSSLRSAIAYLRKHADYYQWTIPHVITSSGLHENKYFALLLEKDKTFHSDLSSQEHLRNGCKSTVKRIATQSKIQAVSLRAATAASYMSKKNRDELNELADECEGVSKKANRTLRYMDVNAANGS